MRILRIILIALAILLLVGVIATFSMSEDYHFEKSIDIAATPEQVYPHISSTKAFNEWNPWLQLDPDMHMEYHGVQGSVGDRYCWESQKDDAGAGCQEITALVPNEKQSTRMEFKRPFEDVANSDIILTTNAQGTTVTWTLDSKLERPMNLMAVFMSSQMDKSYGQGLSRLKQIVENEKR
ncbi:MAG: SRPBCC family protein [Weeksellaceae bacterium]|nr:SRPBCC family protein [Weeksellaceae bacterium]